MYNRYSPYRYNPSLPPVQPPVPITQRHYSPSANPTHDSKPPKKKFNFESIKKDTFKSLNDVECFLNNFSHTWKYIKLIKLLK